MDIGTEMIMEHLLTQRRILIVDDEEKLVLGLQLGLEMLPNCEVAVATDARQALRLCEQRPFDLLITDYQMPGMNGIALAKHIRRLCPQAAIIMITGCGGEMVQEQTKGTSIQRILGKPVGLVDIRRAVLEALENQAGNTQEQGV